MASDEEYLICSLSCVPRLHLIKDKGKSCHSVTIIRWLDDAWNTSMWEVMQVIFTLASLYSSDSMMEAHTWHPLL